MAAPTIPNLDPDLLVRIDPAAAATRAYFARGKRPFSAGYRARATSAGACKLAAVNFPGSLVGGFPIGGLTTKTAGTSHAYTDPKNKVFMTIGKGDTAAQLANGFENYTVTPSGDFVVPSGATATIPQDTDLTDCAVYANAVLLAIPRDHKDREKAILFTRIAKSGSLAASGTWKVNNATSIDVCWDYNATAANSKGVPAGWQLMLILPAAADIITVADSASAVDQAITTADFLVAGASTKANAFTLTRLKQ